MTISIAVLGFVLTLAQASATPTAQAEKLVREGLTLRKSRNDEAALPKFQRAHELAPSPRTFVQLGLCEQALGLWSDADLHLSQALKATDDDWITKNREVIDKSLRDVKGHVGRVDLVGSPDGAEVLINGKPAGRLPLSGPVRVSEGPLSVELRAPGYVPAMRNETVNGGQYVHLVIRLDRENTGPAVAPTPAVAETSPAAADAAVKATPEPQSEADAVPAWRKSAKWVALGGAAVAAGVGIGGSLMMKSKVDDAAGPCGEVSPNDAKCDDLKSGFNTGRTLALVGYTGAAALAVTGLVLFLTEPAATPTESAAARPSRVAFGASVLPGLIAGSATLRF